MDQYVLFAKSAVENYIKEGKIIEPLKGLPDEFFQRRAGTFVTIMKNGNLRGCVGTYLPTRPTIAEEIVRNAIAAATEDYRFGKIQAKELSSLAYTVYILSEPELIKEISELNPEKYGIIIKTTPIASPDGTDVVFNGHLPHKSGLLLPDLEGIDTIEQQISIACQKGGINPVKEKIIIYKFTVEKYVQ